MRTTIIMAAIGLVFCSLSNAEDFLLNGFDTQAEVDQWTVQKNKQPSSLLLNRNPAYVKEGSGSGVFSTPTSKNDGPRWPAFFLRDDKMKTNDWRAFTELKFDVFNPSDKELSLWAMVKMERGENSTQSFILQPGWQSLTWVLPDIVDDSLVKEFQFFQNDPPEARTLYIDHLCLAVSREQLKVRITALTRLIQGSEAAALQKKVGMADRYAAVVQRLNGIDTTRSLLTAGKEFLKIKTAYEKLQKELNSHLDQFAVEELEKTFAKSPWGWGWQRSTQKVFREELPFTGKIGGKITVKLARHEHEAAQLVVRSEKTIKNVSVKAGSFVNQSNGKVLPTANITICPVGYVKRLPASYEVQPPVTWYPDPLLEGFETIDLDADVWQPYWVEVCASHDTSPGTYTGVITVHGDNVPDLKVPVEVTVWNFELPMRTTLKNIFDYQSELRIYAESQAVADEYVKYSNDCDDTMCKDKLSPGARRMLDIQYKIEDMILDHRLSPSRIYDTQHPNRISDLKRYIDRGANCFSIVYVGSEPSLEANDSYPKWRYDRVFSVLKKRVPELKKAGLLPYAVIYASDEIDKNQFKAAREIYSEIKRQYPDIPIATTARDYTFGEKSGLRDLVDIWIPLTSKYEEYQKAITDLRKAGKKFWYYTCCEPVPPSANLLMEQTATAPRLLMGLLAWQYKTDGFLYYHVTFWSDKSPLITRGPLTEHNGRSNYMAFNGDGMLIYPGKNGPLPSIRLKMIRDGLEDYEYLTLLKKVSDKVSAGGVKLTSSQKEILSKLLNPSEYMPLQFENYDMTGEKLQDYRERVGEFLSVVQP